MWLLRPSLGFNPGVISRTLFLSPRCLAIPKKHKLPPRPKWLIVEDEIEEKFIKGGKGPGGQKINKTNSKVQLTHKPTGLVVTCQYSRSQESNRKKAREILAGKLDDLYNPETSRNSVLIERAKIAKRNATKKARRKHRAETNEGEAEEEGPMEVDQIDQIDEIDQIDGIESQLETLEVDENLTKQADYEELLRKQQEKRDRKAFQKEKRKRSKEEKLKNKSEKKDDEEEDEGTWSWK